MSVADGLVLREWTDEPDDVAFVYDMYARPEVRRYIGDGRVMADPAEATAMVRRWRERAEGVLGVRAVCTRGGERLGSILLKHISWSADSDEGRAGLPADIEIGWHLHPDAWGRGVARAAARLVLAEAWDAGVDRIVAVANPANVWSQRVCVDLGMTGAGQTSRYYNTVCELFEITAPALRPPVESGGTSEPV